MYMTPSAYVFNIQTPVTKNRSIMFLTCGKLKGQINPYDLAALLMQ